MILDYEYLQSILQGEGLIVTDFYFPCGSRFGGFGTIYLAVDSRRKQDQRQYNYICFHCFNGWGGLFFFQLGSAGLTLRGLREVVQHDTIFPGKVFLGDTADVFTRNLEVPIYFSVNEV